MPALASTRVARGVPYCRAMENVRANASITALSADPAFATSMNTSPRAPSSYSPNVRYTTTPPILALTRGAFLLFGKRFRVLPQDSVVALKVGPPKAEEPNSVGGVSPDARQLPQVLPRF